MSTQESGATSSTTGASVPTLPQLTSTEASDMLGGGSDSQALLAEMEQRVQQKALAVQSQASELQELEAKLQAAEHKKQELEARAVHT